MQKLVSCAEENQVTLTPMHHTIKVYQGDIYKSGYPYTYAPHHKGVSGGHI